MLLLKLQKRLTEVRRNVFDVYLSRENSHKKHPISLKFRKYVDELFEISCNCLWFNLLCSFEK